MPMKTRFVESTTQGNFTDLATPASEVSAFCRAVLLKIVPMSFWGLGKEGSENQGNVMLHIDRFVHLRRFETVSLHTVCQRLKVGRCIDL